MTIPSWDRPATSIKEFMERWGDIVESAAIDESVGFGDIAAKRARNDLLRDLKHLLTLAKENKA